MDQTERDFIRRSAARVEEWENTPRPFDDPYSDMNTEEKSKLLVYLQQIIDNLNNTVESLREELRQSREQKEELLRGQADLRSALNVLSQSLLSAEAAQKKAESVIEQQARQISDLRDHLKRNNKAQFGSKSQKKRQGNDEPPTHGESKDQFDGTSGSHCSSACIRWHEPRVPQGDIDMSHLRVIGTGLSSDLLPENRIRYYGLLLSSAPDYRSEYK